MKLQPAAFTPEEIGESAAKLEGVGGSDGGGSSFTGNINNPGLNFSPTNWFLAEPVSLSTKSFTLVWIGKICKLLQCLWVKRLRTPSCFNK